MDQSRPVSSTSRGQAPSDAPRGPSQNTVQPPRPGPQRNFSGEGRGRGNFIRGGSRGRGNRGRGGASERGNRGPAPSASNLDAELDAFMKAPTPSATNASIEGDVEMK
ncbi:hypothetical protein CBS101457_004413 [Exobasidium rhododendri]|nr:hypothetical protein CBS101457_004413 [Exobasidium rhododendri]